MMTRQNLLRVIGFCAFTYAVMHYVYLVLGHYSGIPTKDQCELADFQNTTSGLLAAGAFGSALVAVIFATVVYTCIGDPQFHDSTSELNFARWTLAVSAVISAVLAYHWGSETCLQIAQTSGGFIRLVNILELVPAAIVAYCAYSATRDSTATE